MALAKAPVRPPRTRTVALRRLSKRAWTRPAAIGITFKATANPPELTGLNGTNDIGIATVGVALGRHLLWLHQRSPPSRLLPPPIRRPTRPSAASPHRYPHASTSKPSYKLLPLTNLSRSSFARRARALLPSSWLVAHWRPRETQAPPSLPDTQPLEPSSLSLTVLAAPHYPPPPKPSPPHSVPANRREGVLHRAVRDASLAAVRAALIAHPNSVRDTDRQRRTALHLAADYGHPTIAVFLLDARADANALDRQGIIPNRLRRVLGYSRRAARPRMPRHPRRPSMPLGQTLAQHRGRRPRQLRHHPPTTRRKRPPHLPRRALAG